MRPTLTRSTLSARPLARTATVAVAVAGTLLLSGCSLLSLATGGGGGSDEMSGTDAPAAADGSYQAIDLGEPPADMTAPGTQLEVGTGAWVEVSITEDDETVTTQPFGLVVLDIVEGDPSLFDQFDNADEFAGDVPYFIVTQQTRPQQAGSDEVTKESLWPVLADGGSADLLTQYGVMTSGLCDYELPELDTTTGTTVECVVALGTPENPVTEVHYDGLGQYTMFYDETDIYAENPIVWS